MTRTSAAPGLMALLSGVFLAQPAENSPKFEIASVQVSAKTRNPFARATPVRNGRYEIKTASMLDLIRIAYGYQADKILGGPSWLEMDRYDVAAKLPQDTTADDRKLMLQSLLADRFKLVLHKDAKPIPTYVLTVGRKPLMKEADGSEEAGCKPEAGSPGPGGPGRMVVTMNMNGTASTIVLGPGGSIHYVCRNMTMQAFAAGLRGMMGVGQAVGPNEVLDETGLKGAWNFDVRWSWLIGPMMTDNGDRISVFDAIEKQLGLKLEARPVPTPVLVVDSVNRIPTPDSPEVAEALPPIPAPTAFEVADVKASDPGGRGGRFQNQPGGRLVVQNMTMRFLLNRAFNANSNDELIGVPSWADSERFDITAKAPAEASAGPLDTEALAPMLRSLLVERFKLTFHKEDRPLNAYSLVTTKPKMKKAGPASRTSCKNGNGAAMPGTQTLTCQNITMAEFADRLQNIAPGLSLPVTDATGLEGGWDFTLTFSPFASMQMGPLRGGPEPEGAAPQAADPSGMVTIFEAIEKQLGLKLESQKRTLPVFVIDHLEPKPTEN